MIRSFSKSRLASNFLSDITLSPPYILRNIQSGIYRLFVETKICFPVMMNGRFPPFVLPWQSTYIVLNFIMQLGAFAALQFQEQICTYLQCSLVRT
ncbi:hypothetical protein BJY00DRAFT_148638 [Aspergillus carlsbadensis]|nr:hypothetical protein BJY00DRAFT_148638 [Aspergillus carlsbadensis]